jgi:predicted dehydrogenase
MQLPTRRSFLKRTAIFAGALSVPRSFRFPNLFAAVPASSRLNCVQIGCGIRGLGTHLPWVVEETKDNLVAIVDPDENRHAVVRKWLQDHGQEAGKVKAFTDYRVMFDKLGKDIDAVFVATPNHQHAAAAILALDRGKPVFCEKPLCHDIAEARRLREMARQAKVPTQMGNQGHNEEGYRRLCEFVWGGVIGKITETHSWTDRSNGGAGPRPPVQPVPAGVHWDEWIGPAPYRAYHVELHPHDWHGWYDFGNGSLGNMGCHVLDGVYWALKLEHPTAIEAEELRDGTDERFPTGGRIRWDFPARGDMPPVKVYWYEGLKKGVSTNAVKGELKSVEGQAQNLPPLLEELQKKYPDEEFGSNGTLYVGDKGILYTGTYGEKMRLVPSGKMSEITQPPRTLPRPKNVIVDFLEACRTGKKDTAADFDYGARLTEFTLLGNLAERAGVGRKVEWDGPGMKVTNFKELNEWVKRPYRKGWPI